MDPQRGRYVLFETALGACAIAWNDRGLTRLQLPERDRAATEARVRASALPAASIPEAVQRIADSVRDYLAGAQTDFSFIAIDMATASLFRRRIYDAARAIGWGRTATYGELARRVGEPGGARAVGQAMAQNPVPLIIPCHRVLASGNATGGFSAYGGRALKLRLLTIEGVSLEGDAPLLPGIFAARSV